MPIRPGKSHQAIMAEVNVMDPDVKAVFVKHFNRETILMKLNRIPQLARYARYLPKNFHSPHPKDGLYFLQELSRHNQLKNFDRDIFLFYDDPEYQMLKAKNKQRFREFQLAMTRRVTPDGRELPSLPPGLTHAVGDYLVRKPDGGFLRKRKTRKSRR